MNILSSQQVEGHIVPFSEMYPTSAYTQAEVPGQQGIGEPKPRRRRKKNKAANGENGTVGTKKRKLSAEQVNLLEQSFDDEHKLETERKDKLASELGLDPRQVAVWFQNRRARWKNKKMEEEYNRLKSAHDSVVVEKLQLESEALKLKEQLLEAQKEIQRLSERGAEGVSSNSPSSSLSMETMDAPFLGEFGVVQGYDYDDVLYMPENNAYMNGMEWVNLYI